MPFHTLPDPLNRALLLTTLLLSPVVFAHAAEEPLPAAAPALHAPVDQGAGEHRAAIRANRLQHLSDRINGDPQASREHCRYESEITTPPPPQRVALTFDDGPEPGQTEHILEVLERHQVPATFFMIGEKAKRHPDLVAAVQRSGHHLIGNHSWHHPNFHTIAVDVQAREVRDTEATLGAALNPKLFRYPYGNSSCETNTLLKTEGYQTAGWHVDSCDWAFDANGSVDSKEALECGVLPAYRKDYVGHVLSALRAHRGGIVLMYEIHPNTLKSLEAIIEALIAAGYTFGALNDEGFAASLR